MSRHPLLWLDFEATGLDTDLDEPIEVGAILTTPSLAELSRYETVIRPTAAGMDRLLADPFAVAMHEANGLLAALRSGAGSNLVDAETCLLMMLDQRQVGTAILAGSGNATYDYPIIKRRMPTLAARLAYFPHDVGVLRRDYERVTGRALVSVNKDKTHRAMQDIECHLAEGRAFHDFFRHAATSVAG